MTESTLNKGMLIHITMDNSTPWQINRSVIGANHGVSILEITSKAHGLKAADLASEWRDELGKRFYLIKIINNDKLQLLPDNADKAPFWFFPLNYAGNTLQRAIDKKTLTIEKSEQGQLWPSMRIIKKEFLADGTTPLIDDQPIRCHFIEIIDENEIVNPGSVLDDILKHPGKERNIIAKEIDAVIQNNIKYTFYPNGSTIIDYYAKALEPFNLHHMGFIQSSALWRGEFDTLEYYIPKTLPFDTSDNHYDFQAIQSLSSNLSGILYFSQQQDNINQNNPPDRFVQFLGMKENGKIVRKIGFVIGYSLLKGITVPIERSHQINIAAIISPLLKTYPLAIQKNSGQGSIPISAGEKFHCIGYRQYFSPLQSKGTSVYWHQKEDSYVLYADYHYPASEDTIKVPDIMVGKKITVIEKTDSVNILSEQTISQEGLKLNVTGNYGYLVISIH